MKIAEMRRILTGLPAVPDPLYYTLTTNELSALLDVAEAANHVREMARQARRVNMPVSAHFGYMQAFGEMSAALDKIKEL